jgi:hypothetical protein
MDENVADELIEVFDNDPVHESKKSRGEKT